MLYKQDNIGMKIKDWQTADVSLILSEKNTSTKNNIILFLHIKTILTYAVNEIYGKSDDNKFANIIDLLLLRFKNAIYNINYDNNNIICDKIIQLITLNKTNSVLRFFNIIINNLNTIILPNDTNNNTTNIKDDDNQNNNLNNTDDKTEILDKNNITQLNFKQLDCLNENIISLNKKIIVFNSKVLKFLIKKPKNNTLINIKNKKQFAKNTFKIFKFNAYFLITLNNTLDNTKTILNNFLIKNTKKLSFVEKHLGICIDLLYIVNEYCIAKQQEKEKALNNNEHIKKIKKTHRKNLIDTFYKKIRNKKSNNRFIDAILRTLNSCEKIQKKYNAWAEGILEIRRIRKHGYRKSLNKVVNRAKTLGKIFKKVFTAIWKALKLAFRAIIAVVKIALKLAWLAVRIALKTAYYGAKGISWLARKAWNKLPQSVRTRITSVTTNLINRVMQTKPAQYIKSAAAKCKNLFKLGKNKFSAFTNKMKNIYKKGGKLAGKLKKKALNIFKGIGKIFSKIAKKITDKITKFVQKTILRVIKKAIEQFIKRIGKTLIGKIIKKIVGFLLKAIGKLVMRILVGAAIPGPWTIVWAVISGIMFLIDFWEMFKIIKELMDMDPAMWDMMKEQVAEYIKEKCKAMVDKLLEWGKKIFYAIFVEGPKMILMALGKLFGAIARALLHPIDTAKMKVESIDYARGTRKLRTLLVRDFLKLSPKERMEFWIKNVEINHNAIKDAFNKYFILQRNMENEMSKAGGIFGDYDSGKAWGFFWNMSWQERRVSNNFGELGLPVSDIKLIMLIKAKVKEELERRKRALQFYNDCLNLFKLELNLPELEKYLRKYKQYNIDSRKALQLIIDFIRKHTPKYIKMIEAE